jgi:hypothetical protein
MKKLIYLGLSQCPKAQHKGTHALKGNNPGNVQLKNSKDEYLGRDFEYASGQRRATYTVWNPWMSGQECLARIMSES